MYRKSSNHDPLASSLIDAMERCNTFDNLPDPVDYAPVRETYLQRHEHDSLVKASRKADRKWDEYQDRLRERWPGCTDAIPEAFDPHKLEAIRKSRFPSRSTHRRTIEAHDEASGQSVRDTQSNYVTAMLVEPETLPPRNEFIFSPNNVSPDRSSALLESPSTTSLTEPLDTDDQLSGYESDVTAKEAPTNKIMRGWSRPLSNSAGARGRTPSEPPERASTPRIRAGSKPPLSRSAFANSREPCVDERRPLKGYKKPPKYFPYESRKKSNR
ncbi:hypothetical protein F5Y19DRAFT_376120 [Xylariaceae sp. FL1651]|nr:hypothetical protein F5Y19DRAFT_376120 [Xylariaceae sp. FL1651]